MKTSMWLKPQSMLWFFMVGLYFSCAGPSQTAQGSRTPARSASQYEEDLSVLRRADLEPMQEPETQPEGEVNVTTPELGNQAGNVQPTRDVTASLNTLLAESSELNRSVKTIPGYTVQVYLGTSRDGANNAQRKVYELMPESRPDIKFVQPNYRVFVGQFINRLEAQKTYAALRNEFPNALVIPERIQINK